MAKIRIWSRMVQYYHVPAMKTLLCPGRRSLLCAENHIPRSSALVGYHVCLDSRSLGTDVPFLVALIDNNVIDHWLQATTDQSKLNKLLFNLISYIQFFALSLLETDPTEFAKIQFRPLFFLLFQASLLLVFPSLLCKCGVLNLSVSSYSSSYMCRGAPVNIRRHARTHSFSDSRLRFPLIFFRRFWYSIVRFVYYF